MAVDSTTPLCTWAQFTSGGFSDLTRNYIDPPTQTQLLLEATRLCESETSRRLAPFTGMTETHRAQGVDPDEYGDGSDMPLDTSGALGRSYADALGASSLVRHCWLNEYAVRYPEMWAYSDVSVIVGRSVGGTSNYASSQVTGPEPDSGHVWFSLGSYIPVGSIVRVTYSGGYATVPADLVRACKFMTAHLVVRELQPSAQTRDPDQLHANAIAALAGYIRD